MYDLVTSKKKYISQDIKGDVDEYYLKKKEKKTYFPLTLKRKNNVRKMYIPMTSKGRKMYILVTSKSMKNVYSYDLKREEKCIFP